MQIVRDDPKAGIPEILHNLKTVIPLEIENCRGVYFLFLNDEIVYVGQSQNVFKRIHSHIREGVKEFNRVFYTPIPEDLDILKVEKHYINKFRPKYNYETTAKSCDPGESEEYKIFELRNALLGKSNQRQINGLR